MKVSLLFFLLTPLFYAPFAQQPPGQSQYEMAIDLFNAEEYDDGLMILDIALKKQNTDAMVLKGDLFKKGMGVDQSNSKALEWYKNASLLGNYEGMLKFGKLHDDSLVPNADYTDAVDFYIFAYDRGNHNAASLIGLAFFEGHGREQNIDSALAWFNKGALQNDLNCKHFLAKLTLDKDTEKSLINLEELCNIDHAESCALLGELYFKGELLPKDIDKAIQYIEKGIEQDNAKAHFIKASMILEYAIEGTKKEAVQLVDKAKKLGYSEKQCDFLKLRIYGEMH